MTPIEQKIQAAIEDGWHKSCRDNQSYGLDHYILPLVMAVLKPLLDDARAMAKKRIICPGECVCPLCYSARRILAATEPEPGADSSPACANCGRTRESHCNSGTCGQFWTASELAAAQSSHEAMQAEKCATCGHRRDKHIQDFELNPFQCNVDGCACRKFTSTRQAAAVPDKDGVTQKSKVLSFPCECGQHAVCAKEDVASVCTCPCHAKKETAAIPTIAGAADAMKTPGPAEPWAEAFAKLAKRLHAVETKLAAKDGAA